MSKAKQKKKFKEKARFIGNILFEVFFVAIIFGTGIFMMREQRFSGVLLIIASVELAKLFFGPFIISFIKKEAKRK